MERAIDLTLEPTEGARERAFYPPSVLRVYESSIEGMTTVAMLRESEPRCLVAFTRLTKAQARELYDQLGEYLGVEDYERGFADGHLAGEAVGYDEGFAAATEVAA